MSNFFQRLNDAIDGLKNLGQVLEELRAIRVLIQQNVDTVQGYTSTLRDIHKQLTGIVSGWPFIK